VAVAQLSKRGKYRSGLRIQDVARVRNDRSTGSVEASLKSHTKPLWLFPPGAPDPPVNPEPLRDGTFPVGPVGVFVRAPYSAKAVFGSVVPVLEAPAPPFWHAARKTVMPSTINPVAHRDSFRTRNNSRTNW